MEETGDVNQSIRTMSKGTERPEGHSLVGSEE